MTCGLRSCRWWADRRRWRSLHTSLSVNLIHTIVNISIQINTITIYLPIAVPFTKLKTCHYRHVFHLSCFFPLPKVVRAAGAGDPGARLPEVHGVLPTKRRDSDEKRCVLVQADRLSGRHNQHRPLQFGLHIYAGRPAAGRVAGRVTSGPESPVALVLKEF